MPPDRVYAWFDEHEMGGLVDEVTNVKPPAFAYIDDRAICFRGDYTTTLSELACFKAHWEGNLMPQQPRNTVVALGELKDWRTSAQVRHEIVFPKDDPSAPHMSVATSLMCGDERLPDGSPVLVVVLPDTSTETLQRIMRTVQAIRYEDHVAGLNQETIRE